MRCSQYTYGSNDRVFHKLLVVEYTLTVLTHCPLGIECDCWLILLGPAYCKCYIHYVYEKVCGEKVSYLDATDIAYLLVTGTNITLHTNI